MIENVIDLSVPSTENQR